MLNYWMASCWIGGTGIVTANTEGQLRTRTMAEMGKWHTLALNRHWFEKSTMALRPAGWFKDLVEGQLGIDTQYYYVEGQTWSEDNPDAFAGAHSQIAMMLTFDEASGISNPIWNVSEGFFTDLGTAAVVGGRSVTRDRRPGGSSSASTRIWAFWDTKTIDSRTVEGIDAAVYQRIADKYGEDHDVTRVEVKGEFPKSGDRHGDQFGVGRGGRGARRGADPVPHHLGAGRGAVRVGQHRAGQALGVTCSRRSRCGGAAKT